MALSLSGRCYGLYSSLLSTGSALAAASAIHRQMPTNMADIRRDWLTNQNTERLID